MMLGEVPGLSQSQLSHVRTDKMDLVGRYVSPVTDEHILKVQDTRTVSLIS